MDETMLELMTRLKRESIQGGELTNLPCPLCGLPRSQRSDYVRCTPCAMNWLDGEDLTRDPRIDRFNKVRGARPASVSTDTKTASPASATAVDASAD